MWGIISLVAAVYANSLDNKLGSCWILKDFYCSVTTLRELGIIRESNFVWKISVSSAICIKRRGWKNLTNSTFENGWYSNLARQSAWREYKLLYTRLVHSCIVRTCVHTSWLVIIPDHDLFIETIFNEGNPSSWSFRALTLYKNTSNIKHKH